MTTASKITLVRVFMIPLVMIAMYLSKGVSGLWMWISLGLFVIASVTDFIDGQIARRWRGRRRHRDRDCGIGGPATWTRRRISEAIGPIESCRRRVAHRPAGHACGAAILRNTDVQAGPFSTDVPGDVDGCVVRR